MKKQIAIVTSFCALLTLSALAPKFFWQDSHNSISRFPASDEIIVTAEKEEKKEEENKKNSSADIQVVEVKAEQSKVADIQVVEVKVEKPEALNIQVVDVKVEKPKALDIQVVEVKVAEEVAKVACLDEKQPTALEEEIKKLVIDKETILKEINDLKATKIASQKTEKVEKTEKEEKTKKTSKKENDSLLLSNMTSMMISQQEQQKMLTQQMFSMMNQMMQMQMDSNSRQNSQNFMGPMNFEAPQYGMSNFYPRSSIFGHNEPGVGIGYPAQSAYSYKNPYATLSRSPSAQNELGYNQRDLNVQPQLQTHYPAPNFSFTTSDYSSEMQRMEF